jgi:quinol monooxygenase YgiN
MGGICVIVAYRPKPGKEQELLKLVRERVPTLRKEGLVTDRVPAVMRAKDGTIIEVSEWKSRQAIDAAHKNPNVLAMWERFFLRSVIACRLIRWRRPRRCSPVSNRSMTETKNWTD